MLNIFADGETQVAKLSENAENTNPVAKMLRKGETTSRDFREGYVCSTETAGSQDSQVSNIGIESNVGYIPKEVFGAQSNFLINIRESLQCLIVRTPIITGLGSPP